MDFGCLFTSQLQILTKESLPQETKYGYPFAPATIPISKTQSL